MRPVWRRRRSVPDDEPDAGYPAVDILSSTRWGFSRVLADLGLFFLAAGGLLLLLGGQAELRQKVLWLLPASVRGYFQSQTAGPLQTVPAVEPRALKKLGKVLPEPAPRKRRPLAGANFGIGSTEDEVRAIQGAPTAESDGVWTYGNSEVRFASGRVVSWRSDPADPLRVE